MARHAAVRDSSRTGSTLERGRPAPGVENTVGPVVPHDGPGRQRPTGSRRAHRSGTRDLLCVGAIIVVAALLRLVNIGSAYDVHIDEYFYNGLATSAAHGDIPPHVPPGWRDNASAVFLLHPPGFFVLAGLWQHLTGTGTNVFDAIYRTRALNALLGALTAGLMYVLGNRVAGRRVGLAAAALFALDPFVLRQNGRVLLETATLFWAVAGYVVIIGISRGTYRRPRAAAVSAGLLFGFAMLTKDVTAIETVGALLAMALLGWGIPRRTALLSAAVAVLTYCSFILVCVVQGYGGALWDAKTLGIRRQLGLVQITGFNRPGSVSLTSTLWAQLGSFGPTYLLVALGAAAGVWLLRSRRGDHRILGVFAVSAIVFLGYSLTFGTIEEQFLYFMIVPAILSTAVAAGELWRRTTVRPARRRGIGHALVIGLAALCVWNSAVWFQIRTTPDNATQAAVTWLQHNSAGGSPIGVTSAPQAYAIWISGLSTVSLGSPESMALAHVRFAVLSSRNTALNYAYVGPQQAAWYHKHGRVVFTFDSASQGVLAIYQTSDPALW